jgi:DNA-directed RNA polymerase specialized sigma24 family protein
MTSASDLEFVAFVQDASPRLLRTAWFVCGDPVQAEDLVQAALEKVYLRWRRIDRGAATAYARKILFNQHIDTRRRRSREVLTDQMPERAARHRPLKTPATSCGLLPSWHRARGRS